ncbi:Hypothetical predicted protein [Pelobates cultripes]|uniref:Uncharacterized protein n=1 Tax=Pelobates cultripes TaxID=61616 RepID=A0AAD1WEZ4_PELCU|nr:Hypothetical predicted protein [Pelobates cultripes]
MKTLLLDDAAWQMKSTRRYFYERANRIDTPLAKFLRLCLHSKPITTIRVASRTLVSAADEIYKAFREYFSTLYNQFSDWNGESPEWGLQLKEFLVSLNLLSIPIDILDTLETRISMEDIKSAILSIKGGKTPVLDGFSGSYYKIF